MLRGFIKTTKKSLISDKRKVVFNATFCLQMNVLKIIIV